MLKLYTVPSANGQRATIALEECGVEYETQMVDLVAGEHRSPKMLELSPIGRMPVLVGNDGEGRLLKLYGSLSIGEYYAETSGKLRPSRDDLADYHQWLNILMTDLAPAFSVQFYLGTLAPERFEWGIGVYNDMIERMLGVIDAHLADNRYFLGDDYTLPDVMMYPTAASSAARLESGLAPWPNIARWRDEVGKRPAVERGMERSSGEILPGQP